MRGGGVASGEQELLADAGSSFGGGKWGPPIDTSGGVGGGQSHEGACASPVSPMHRL